MEINPNRPIGQPSKIERKAKISGARSHPEEEDETTFIGSDLFAAIENGLQALPEVRKERLQSGKELASDPDYPSEADLEDLSKLTLKNISQDENQEKESE